MQLGFCHIPLLRQRDAQVLPLSMRSEHIIKLLLAGRAGWNKAETAYWEKTLCRSLANHLVGHPLGLMQSQERIQMQTVRLETEVGSQQESLPRAGYARFPWALLCR